MTSAEALAALAAGHSLMSIWLGDGTQFACYESSTGEWCLFCNDFRTQERSLVPYPTADQLVMAIDMMGACGDWSVIESLPLPTD